MGSQVTVYRSAENSAKEDAADVQQMLTEAGIPAVLLDDTVSGVVVGTYEVRVDQENTPRAEQLIAALISAQLRDSEAPEDGDPSHSLDLVTVFSAGSGTGAEMEAMSVQSILDAGGIKAVFVGDARYPIFPMQVRVAKTDEAKALDLIKEALAAGPEGALEAEEAGEKA